VRAQVASVLANVPGWRWAVVLATLAGVLYLVVGPEHGDDAFSPLADAFLAGRLTVPDGSSVELVPHGDGFNFVPNPPIPALPFMATNVLHLSVPNPTLTALAGGIAVLLAYGLLRGLDAPVATSLTGSAALAAAMVWIAGTGGTWLYAQVLAAALLLGSLNLAVRDRWPLAAGLLLGLAAGSRLPCGLALPLLLYLYRARRRSWLLVLDGLVAVAIPLIAYNFVRFGSPLDFGYDKITFPDGRSVLDEPLYADGIESITYIPRSLGVMFFSGFDVVTAFPWLRPNFSGLSVFLVAPAFVMACAGWRTRLGAVACGTAVLIMLPNWAHGTWGLYQFGFRFFLDAMPVLLVALAVAYRERVTPALLGAVLLTASVNAYGLWADAASFIGDPPLI
jgi:hypothetical protein